MLDIPFILKFLSHYKVDFFFIKIKFCMVTLGIQPDEYDKLLKLLQCYFKK